MTCIAPTPPPLPPNQSMSDADDDTLYEEEIIEIDEDGNEWLVEVEEYEEEVTDDEGGDDDAFFPLPTTIVVSNLQALDDNNSVQPSLLSQSNHSKAVDSCTPTVLVSNRNKKTPPPPNTTDNAKGLGSRFKNLMKRSDSSPKESPVYVGPPPPPETAPKRSPVVAGKAAPTVPAPVPEAPPRKVKKTRQIRRVRKPKGTPDGSGGGGDDTDAVVGTTGGTTATTNTEGNDNNTNEPAPKVVYTQTIVRDETTGRELSRESTGRRPPHYQPQGPNEKRYATKTYRKTRVNPVNRHKEVEERTVITEKPRSVSYERELPASALRPTPEHNPARLTTEWEKPSWAVQHGARVAASSLRTGVQLEKPITAATTNRKNAGTLSFTIERA